MQFGFFILHDSPEGISLLNWTLRHEWHAIIILSSFLQDSMPMNCHFHALHMILNVDNNSIILADLNTWPGNHTIGCENTALNAIS